MYQKSLARNENLINKTMPKMNYEWVGKIS